MLSRLMTTQKPTSIPQEWLNEVNAVLNETYKSQCESLGSKIVSYGEIYPDELSVAFSILDKHNDLGKAITLFTSTDLDKKSDPKKLFDHILNSSSEFFDLIFSNDLDNEGEIYQSNWAKTDLSENNFFYKISRENLNITLKANQLLGEN